ncbi:MAG TPA: DedA family protein [Candidatus Binatia bacterium]|nr:DedA family protein [Candidatus Binatia bacterium]
MGQLRPGSETGPGRIKSVAFFHQHDIIAFVSRYAYGGIFGLLVFGIVGLPIPDEFLLTFVGFLVFRGQLNFAPALAAAFAGSACGITLSYLLGRTAGSWVLHRYGHWLHVDEALLQRVHAWFERYGGWTLTFGYFIAGVRHLTALVAGSAEFEPPRFAAFAYAGALLWTTTFIGLGVFLGERWHEASRLYRHLPALALAALLLVLVVYLIWRWTRPGRATGG